MAPGICVKFRREFCVQNSPSRLTPPASWLTARDQTARLYGMPHKTQHNIPHSHFRTAPQINAADAVTWPPQASAAFVTAANLPLPHIPNTRPAIHGTRPTATASTPIPATSNPFTNRAEA